jgi:hypothetical protein
MPDSLALLEKQRTELFRQITGLGDLRRGSITTTSGKCGKPTCHCAQPNDPGHGPNFRLTRKVQGKTVTETFASSPGLAEGPASFAIFKRGKTVGPPRRYVKTLNVQEFHFEHRRERRSSRGGTESLPDR